MDRNLFVDDWIDTGGQALAVRGLVEDSGAYWLGAAVIVDDLADARLRRDLGVRSIQHGRDIWPQPNLLAGRASRGGPTGFNTVSRHRPQARDRAGWET